MIIHIVRFTSALPDERIHQLFEARLSDYEELPGLVQKYYLRYDDGGHGGVYVWRSREDLAAFRASELSKSISQVYEVEDSTVSVAEVTLQLRLRDQVASNG
jgi:heme-degrading monooxygenase HmoA